MIGGADISGCQMYRYRLWRYWGDGPEAVWVMLNPSTANAISDDPTIRKCIGFTKRWAEQDGMPTFGGIIVVNLYALRATNPSQLIGHPNPVGPMNDKCIRDALRSAAYVITAWGAPKSQQLHSFADREHAVMKAAGLVATSPVCHLGRTKHGHPRHPLYIPYDTNPQRW